MKTISIGTRGSKLALNQANEVKKIIESNLNIEANIKTITTQGDIDKTTPIYKIPDKGFYTKEIEMSLLKHEIDIAVHSLKDLPLELSPPFEIPAVLKRRSPMDILLTENLEKIRNFSDSSIIAVGSLRRKNQLKKIFPNIKTVDIRGNIETRIKKIYNNDWHGLIVAKAAIERLKLNYKYYEFTDNEMIPAPCQGIVAVETLKERTDLNSLIKKINHQQTFNISKIEQNIAISLEGGCKIPVGCLAQIDNDKLKISTYISTINGDFSICEKITGDVSESRNLIKKILSEMQNKGLQEILNERNN